MSRQPSQPNEDPTLISKRRECQGLCRVHSRRTGDSLLLDVWLVLKLRELGALLDVWLLLKLRELGGLLGEPV